jgi:hypothetical protein
VPAVFANNAVSTLAVAIDALATELLVQTSDAIEFPTPGAGEWFPVTLYEGVNLEIVHCTARTGATLTIERGQEDTVAQAFGMGAQVSHRLTKAALDEFIDDAPSDGVTYGRKNGGWVPAAEGGGGGGGGGGDGVEEVEIGNSTPASSVEIWIDTDEPAQPSGAWTQMTNAAYTALPVKDPDTLYILVD